MGSASLIISDSVAASAVINTIQLADLQTSPEIAVTTLLTIPAGQTWVIEDLFILVAANAGTSDPQLRFVKNQTATVSQSQQLSALLVSNTSRPKLVPKIGLEAQSQLQVYLITTVANDATIDAIYALAPIDKRF